MTSKSLSRTPLALVIGALLALPSVIHAQQAVPLDEQARVLMGEGDASDALRLMREHVASNPGDQDAVLDLARYLTWNGDYAGAKRVLDANPEAEQSAEGQAVLAAVLAWAGRIRGALETNAAPLAAEPDALSPNYTQAIALRQSARPRAALHYVEAVKRAKPDTKDAHALERVVRIHTDSFVALDYQHASDSDDLVRSQPTLRAEIGQGEALRWTLDVGRWDFRSPLSSPFASTVGGRSIGETRGLFGVRYAPSPYTELSAAVGHSSIDGDGLMLWRLGLDQRFSDSFRLDLQADHDRVAASPRSVSLGLDRTGIAGHAHWTPDFNWTGDLWLRHDHYSDGNNSVDWNLALRRAAVRRPHFMLDLGATVEHLSFDDNPGNGYYAPDNYRRYALAGFSYIGVSDDVGLSIQAGLGRQRDETFTGWRRANDIGAQLVLGVLSPWQLSLNAGYSERVQNTGAYEGHTWGITLTHRF